jgi:hypothetical protein
MFAAKKAIAVLYSQTCESSRIDLKDDASMARKMSAVI